MHLELHLQQDDDTCAYNDLALVRIDPADVDDVNPSVPFYGGPAGLTDTVTTGAQIFTYGNSSLRQGISLLSPKRGLALSQDSAGYNHTGYTVTPGIPGDSGSGFLDASGKAFGVLSTVALAPLPASNGIGDLSRELDYMHAHSDNQATLVKGTEPFTTSLLGNGTG